MRKWLLLALALAIVVWLALNMERYSTVVHERSNAHHYAAAATLLEQQDIQSRRVHSGAELADLPDTDALLIFDANRAQLTEIQISKLHQWVRDGGRLVIAARLVDFFHDFDESEDGPGDERYQNEEGEFYDAAFYRDQDPLTYSFGVTGWHNDYHGDLRRQDAMTGADGTETAAEYFIAVCLRDMDKDNALECEQRLCGDFEVQSAYAVHREEDESWRFDLDPHADLLHRDFFEWADDEDPADYPETPATETSLQVAAGNDYGDQLLLLNYGEGEVWVLSDLAIFENERLYHLEHAWLLNRMAEGTRTVWWVQSVSVPPLMHWLWRNGWPVLVAFLLFLTLFIWQRMPRRGVILEDNSQRSDDFLEHLKAGSRFLWQAHQRQATLKPLRHQVQRLLARHKNARETESDADIAARISGMDRADIRFALSGETDDDAEFLHIVQTLQALRSRL